jgi:N-acetyl-anhydromuramyl-L-alanine amidase AmpD
MKFSLRPRRDERSAWALVTPAVLLAAVIALIVATHDNPSPARPVQWADITPEASAHPWRWIVIHHSGDHSGDSTGIDSFHERKKGWDGIGYHFVIGNGAPMPRGRVEATFRWRLQRRGAHAGPAPEHKPYNQDGIGICVIGNYQDEPFDPFLEDRLVSLCAQLIHRIPTLSADAIVSHRDLKSTDCPGKNVDVERIRRRVVIALATMANER